jgi:hypothetical protein
MVERLSLFLWKKILVSPAEILMKAGAVGFCACGNYYAALRCTSVALRCRFNPPAFGQK